MPRTTTSLVKEIIDTDSSVSLVPFIRAANLLVTKCCSTVTSYTTADLREIETWLAAHMYTVFDPRTVMEQAGSVQETFQSKVDLGLRTSHYGQMAMRLDTNGGLAALDNAMNDVKLPLPVEVDKRKVGMTWLGSCPPPSGCD